MPLDAATDLPAGRIAFAWFGYDGDTGSPVAEVAYDVAWPAPSVTPITLADLAPPSADRYEVGFECGGTMIGPAALGWFVVSSDPDGDGSVSESEFLDFMDSAFPTTSYGIAQALILDSPVGCESATAVPGGILAGRHIYRANEDATYTLADGMEITLTTCAPGTAACEQLDRP